jgi:hypothetical protein
VWSGDAHLTMESEEFLKPKLVGGRFEGHAIPLDFLRDLVALNDIVLEGARAAYYKANPDRKRLPNGFADEFTLSLSGVEPGSAIPKITLFFALLGGVPAQAVEFLHQSRENFVSGIRAAAEDGQPADYLTPKALTQFKNFGERLRDGEAIEFDDPAPRYASPRKCVVSFCYRRPAWKRFRKRSIFAGPCGVLIRRRRYLSSNWPTGQKCLDLWLGIITITSWNPLRITGKARRYTCRGWEFETGRESS